MPQEDATVDIEEKFLVTFGSLNDPFKLRWISEREVRFVFNALDDVSNHDFINNSFKLHVVLRLTNVLVDRDCKFSNIHKPGVLWVKRGQHFEDIALSEHIRHQLL
jgi:hypothetical protein